MFLNLAWTDVIKWKLYGFIFYEQYFFCRKNRLEVKVVQFNLIEKTSSGHLLLCIQFYTKNWNH